MSSVANTQPAFRPKRLAVRYGASYLALVINTTERDIKIDSRLNVAIINVIYALFIFININVAGHCESSRN